MIPNSVSSEPAAAQKWESRCCARLSRDSPDESQTGINVRVFPALLQERREVLTATSTSRNPNAWSRGWPGHVPWHLDALLLSVARERVTIERFMLARVVAAAVAPRSAAVSPGTFVAGWRPP